MANSNYKEENWNKLPGTREDILAIKKALEQHNFKVELHYNLNLREMDEVLQNFAEKYGYQENNRLLYYYAGHGATLYNKVLKEDVGYLIPLNTPNPAKTDSPARFKKNAFPFSKIIEYAKTHVESKHALFLFDACFSGSLFESRSGTIEPKNIPNFDLPIRYFISSGTGKESVPDKSEFRRQFIKALTSNEADYNGDTYLTEEELGWFLRNSVSYYTSSAQNPQFGAIRDSRLDKGDFIFNLPKKESGLVQNQLNTGTLAPKQALVALEAESANLSVVDNIFAFSERHRTAVIRLKNFSDVEGNNVKVRGFAYLDNRIEEIDFTSEKLIFPGDISILDTDLRGFPLENKPPDSIVLCITHGNKNTSVKTKYKYMLDDRRPSLSIQAATYTYRVKLLNRYSFTNKEPSCLTDTSKLTSDTERVEREATLKKRNKIRHDAITFLMGMNRKKENIFEPYCTKEVLSSVKNILSKQNFGFKPDIDINNFNTKVAYVTIYMTNSEFKNRMVENTIALYNRSKTFEDFENESILPFMKENGFTWTAKLVKKGENWKFTVHEESEMAKKK
ncbi:caspase family protein [Flagellimonas onchidii]|uniref:caspase family protein n=1 Tax=Flagellimonas onchidii TaxID=2562684 RepID=UPI001F0FB0AD|nr:caspase family protein [Allomuricauda onchidii]